MKAPTHAKVMADTTRATGMGASVLRVEDAALLTGNAGFLDDIPVAAPLHACFVRSPHAHARILSMDLEPARAMPGVVAVYASADLYGQLTEWRMPLGFALAALPANTTPFVLAAHEVAFVGEAIVLVVAQSRHLAEDAAAMVAIEYELLEAVSDCREASEEASPRVRTELESNVLQRYTLGYGDCEAAFGCAHRVLSERFWTHRGAAHPMEGRGVLAMPEPASGTLTVWSSTQMAHELHYTIALMLGQPEDQLRVITPDVGGGFGAKFMIYPEEIAIPAAARMLGRPVKWLEDRRENFLTSIQERDQYWSIEYAVDADGHILAVRGDMVHDHGAYTPQGTNVPYNSASSLSGPYRVPAYDLDVRVVYTNKVPVATVRGAGYPQAAFVMERMIDRIALELGIDRAECRRRNFIPPEDIPYTKPLKSRAGVPLTIDSGDFPALQARALLEIDYEGFEARRAEAASRGWSRGVAVANSVKPTGRGPFESARVRVLPSGQITIYTGALAMGQGIKTTLAQICAAHFGVQAEAVQVQAGDTSFINYGMGGFASRQAIMAGSAVEQAAAKLRTKIINSAAALLNVEPDSLTLANGELRGPDNTSVSLARLAMLWKGVPGYALPQEGDPGLDETVHFHCDAQAYAGASHACEVEVDPLTGEIRIVRYVAVQDSGRIINPMLAHGQVHGGVVHGIGNALFEWMGYDAGGQPITTTFAEYLLPTAPEVPRIDVFFQPSPTTLNPLGVKGIGECATVPVAAAVIGAVEHALSDIGVRLAEFPLSPVRLLELIDRASGEPVGACPSPEEK
ncbi:xanthine dehydrogenase family protein molybdopterin-binding subunit [Achromobacter pestifer]|uniref:6-hydroxypseudooxynicotine dehydrogenase complex subunit gamma n=1 Tax=Achromobacter pestifer TaxID=1353889 RepID=A0A6S7AI22_9BURK|nr:xanthine dehydrogenase family protein molybdopterin-binding subunit [Achromobacter pestifer]CAB3671320.1 6-hydroxypseudooxynicotine dehydrogenase complex subunit gamma [Achromobacter pestifer]